MAGAGPYTVTYFYFVIGLSCAIITHFFVPETKGKSLEQIQEYFESKVTKKEGKNCDIEEACEMIGNNCQDDNKS